MSLTVSEMYNKIYGELKDIRDAYDSAKARIAGKTDDDILLRERRISNLENQLKRIEEYRGQVEYYRHQAEKHLESKNLLTITPRELNFNRLRNWAMMMDPTATDDSYAQRIYVQCMCNQMFLDLKEEEFNQTLDELRNTSNSVDDGLIKETEDVINKLIERETALFSTDLSDQFAQELSQRQADATDVDKMESLTENEKQELFSIGSYAVPFPVLDELVISAKAKYGSYFKEDEGLIYLPASFFTEKEFVLRIEASPNREKTLYRGVQNLVLNQLVSGGKTCHSVIVLDAVHFNNQMLGVLRPLEGTVVEQIPQDADELIDSLKQIIYSFTELDEKIGFADSVEQFNKAASPEEYIPRRTIIVVGYPHAFNGEGKDLMQRLIYNHDHYGISLILIDTRYSPRKEGNLFGEESLEEDNVYRIRMSKKEDTLSVSDEKRYTFSWYELKQTLSQQLIERLKELNPTESKLGTEYDKRIEGFDEVPVYERGKKSIILPYGVESDDTVQELCFDEDNFASYLVGASGSGKSTLLHTLITGIIRNYHPDDVELWLADFKMAEFSQYINPMPPHIRYILLDESQELVYDLIDRLVEKMMERQKFFMKHKDLKKAENVKRKEKVTYSTYMPIIFVILDEFSIMSQAIADNEEYKLKLQNLLAKGRALGIKFLFSSQTFTSGIAGLTATAKAQIQLRIAMKGSREEISETLELSSNQKTDQVQAWMDALPPHYAMVKYRVEDCAYVRRVEVMYFTGSEDDPYEKQKDLIRKINQKFHAVSSEAETDDDIDAYVEKSPVVVDGNSYNRFDDASFRRKVNDYFVKNEKESKDEISFIDFGTPRLMSDYRFAMLTPETRENVLFVAPYREQACAASVILSIMHSFKIQRKAVGLWTYGRSRLYKDYRNMLELETTSKDSIAVDVDSIIKSIKQYKDLIERKQIGDEIIVLIGMERICGDFEFADSDNEYSGGMESIDSLIIEQEQELAQAGAVASTQQDMDAAALAVKMITEGFDPFTDENSVSDIAKLENDMDDNGEIGNDTDEIEENRTQIEEKPYDAMADLQYILKKGSRMGYHFVVVFQNFSDLRGNGLNIDWFRHRLSFQIPEDDSRELFGKKIATTLPQHICYYSDQLETFSFRPYIHKGVDWDGWMIDEDDKLISPMDIQ